MEGYERKNKEENHKELQDLDLIGSSHIEEKVIGGNVDLDLLSLFPQRYARIMGGIERWVSFPRSTMERERERGASSRFGGGLLGQIFPFWPDNPPPDYPAEVWPG
jgi:hypothetical protein